MNRAPNTEMMQMIPNAMVTFLLTAFFPLIHASPHYLFLASIVLIGFWFLFCCCARTYLLSEFVLHNAFTVTRIELTEMNWIRSENSFHRTPNFDLDLRRI